jgi:hypothetical protein
MLDARCSMRDNMGIAERVMGAVHISRVQAKRWLDDNEVQRSHAGQSCDALTAPAANGRATLQEERHITTQLSCNFRQLRTMPMESPSAVRQSQRSGRVARPAPQAGGKWNPLHELDACAIPRAALLLQQL